MTGRNLIKYAVALERRHNDLKPDDGRDNVRAYCNPSAEERQYAESISGMSAYRDMIRAGVAILTGAAAGIALGITFAANNDEAGIIYETVAGIVGFVTGGSLPLTAETSRRLIQEATIENIIEKRRERKKARRLV